MRNLRKEFLVGCLVLSVVVLMGIFAWLLGALEPFSHTVEYNLLYGFAGGIEVGSPVRVAGIKVGKVEGIVFLPESAPEKSESGSAPVALNIRVSVSNTASPSVREDSKFYVNMAGVIGERYIEISPGTIASPPLKDGSTVRGMDPPRIDQLLSQGYGLFGKVTDFFEKNEEGMNDFLDSLSEMMNRKDWKKLLTLIDNVNALTADLRYVSKKLRSQQAEDVWDKLYDMVDRAHQIDKETLKQFLQEEGIRARIF